MWQECCDGENREMGGCAKLEKWKAMQLTAKKKNLAVHPMNAEHSVLSLRSGSVQYSVREMHFA
jgi:hypothetical protein